MRALAESSIYDDALRVKWLDMLPPKDLITLDYSLDEPVFRRHYAPAAPFIRFLGRPQLVSKGASNALRLNNRSQARPLPPSSSSKSEDVRNLPQQFGSQLSLMLVLPAV